jgi:hypothetical protein
MSLLTVLSLFMTVPTQAKPAPGLCAMNTVRGSVPADFPIDACMNNSELVLSNTLTVPVNLSITGSTGNLVRVSTDYGTPADLTRYKYPSPLLLLPGDIVRIPVGTGAATVSIAGTEAGGFYALATTLNDFLPGGTVKAVWDSMVTMISDMSGDVGQYENCVAGKNWIGQLGCQAVLIRGLLVAIGKGVLTGTAKAALAVIVNAAFFAKWAYSQPGAIAKILGHSRTITFSAVTSTGGSGKSSSGGSEGPGGSPGPQAAIHLTQGPAAPSGYRYAITLSGFPAAANVSVTCYDSVSIRGFYTFTMHTDSAGDASTATACYSADGPDHWVKADGISSNHVTWQGGSGSTPLPQPPSATYAETVGGNAHTWTNYSNAGGTQGPTIPAYTTVHVSCKIQGFRVADGDTWWYRIASSPWSGHYYVSADAFYNDGRTSGSLAGTPFVDSKVPTC